MKRISIRGIRQSISNRLSSRHEDHAPPGEDSAKLSRPLYRDSTNMIPPSMAVRRFARDLVRQNLNRAAETLQGVHNQSFALARNISTMVDNAKSATDSLWNYYTANPNTNIGYVGHFRRIYRKIYLDYMVLFSLLVSKLYMYIFRPKMVQLSTDISRVLETIQSLMQSEATTMEQVEELYTRDIRQIMGNRDDLMYLINDWDTTLFLLLGNYRSLDDHHVVFSEVFYLLYTVNIRTEASSFKERADNLERLFTSNMLNYCAYLEYLRKAVKEPSEDNHGILDQYVDGRTAADEFRDAYVRQSIIFARHPLEIYEEVRALRHEIRDVMPRGYEDRVMLALLVDESGDGATREFFERIMVDHFHMTPQQLSRAGARSSIVHDVYEQAFGRGFVQRLYSQGNN